MNWDKDRILDELHTVYDPEVGLNIVEMGLVYDVDVSDRDDVHVLMTLTTPGCPMHGSIAEGVERRLEALGGIGRVTVSLTFNPPWDPSRLSPEAIQKLQGGDWE